MNERQNRIGLNEAVFRQVNDRIVEIGQTLQRAELELDLVCECGDADCAERIRMSASEYEALRRDPALFAVVPGHEAQDVEFVRERRGEYDIVEKNPGAPMALAEDTDPRS